MPGGRLAGIEWAVEVAAFPGQTAAGDDHVVAPFVGGALLAVIDGLGHGLEAAAAAARAAAILRSDPAADPVELIRRSHRELAQTRGAAITLAAVEPFRARLTWLGVGNVEAFIRRADATADTPRETLMTRSGVVGYQLPSLRASVVPLYRGDTVVLATDGIASGFGVAVSADQAPADVASRILTTFGKSTDDALVLVARCDGLT